MNLAGFFDEVDPDACGGKGGNLVALVENGFPVPQGFVVTVEAYRQFKSKSDMPRAAAAAITRCYQKLVAASGHGRVAVRSSASAEDGALASFAGQYDTYLGIEGAQAVVQHVVECWRSLHSERSKLYRQMMKLPDEGLEMAVVVQTLLSPRCAGVVFTSNPYTMDENLMIVESSRGLGENVVSGTVTPDYFEILKNDGFDIVKQMAGAGQPGSGEQGSRTNHAACPDRPAVYSIEAASLKRLCAMACRIEGVFGGPQDIEWAVNRDDTISILQSRPLTRFKNR